MTNTEKTAMIQDITDRKIVADAAKEDLTNAVVRAVLTGVSWAEIGKTLKISKQTAYNRYNTHVETYKRFDVGTSTLTAEDEQNMMDSLWNPEPYTGFLHVRNRQWKREPTMARYSCSCGWNVVYPEHDAEGAFDDIAEHEATAHEGIPQEENYGDEDGTQEPEKAAKKIDAPAPAKSETDRPMPGAKVKTKTEQEALADIDSYRARKATLPEICPGCDTGRWHRHNTAYAGCTETQNDHVWSEEWPHRVDGTFTEVIGKHLN